MALFHNPQIVRSGLVFAYDSANRKSYQGPPIQNKLTSISPMTTSGTGYSFIGGAEFSDIPSIGPTTVQTCNIQNNYSAVSTWCCPNPFSYGSGIPVSGSTLYTYAIVYRVESGYTSANYMYRYEYNGGTYVTESGVHNDSNRVNLGNGWYWAWATFTTQPTTNSLNGLASFYYRYSTLYDKLSVAKILLVQGDYSSLHPKYWPDVNTTRSSTQVLVDLTRKNTVTATSLTYNSNGSFSFNGAANYIDCGTGGALTLGNNGSFTVSAWINLAALKPYSGIISKVQSDRGGVYSFMCTAHNDGTLAFYNNATWYYSTNAGITTNTWYNVVFSFNGTTMSYYVNGVAYGTSACTWPETTAHKVFIGSWYSPNTAYDLNGTISAAQLYNRPLSATEIAQNFNALRGRYGI